MNTGWNDRRPVRQIDINSLKPQASIDAINKIISGKVIGYFIDEARTGSMYLSFEVPETEKDFKIRTSNHSKIDGVHDDTVETYENEIEINIFSKEKKDEALKFLKNYFAKIKALPASKEVFQNVVEKKVIKSKHNETVLAFFKKIKIDATKTDKQIQQQLLDYLIKKGTPATLKKREYIKSRGVFKLDKEYEIKGNLSSISTTGKQVTINRETGKDFKLDNLKDRYLLVIATERSAVWEYYVKEINIIK